MTSTMARRFGMAVILTALATPGAAAQDEKDQVKGPLRRMQGEWTFTASNGDTGTFRFEGDQVTAEMNDQKYVAKTTANRQAEPHPTIDFDVKEAPGDVVGKTLLGIFKFDGARKLILCVGGPDQSRPTEFKAEGDGAMLFELTKKE